MALIVKDTGRRWVNGFIPFKLHSSVTDPGLIQNFNDAKAAWEKKTPITFVPQTSETDFILLKQVPGATKCSSPAGRKGGPQELNCDSGFNLATMVHELGHAIGLHHEHQRPDRDASMAVSAAAIVKEPENYARRDDEWMVGPYDLVSVMHYEWSTATNQKPITKITPFPPATYPTPPPIDPSIGDAEGVKFMYGIVPERTPITSLRRGDDMEIWLVGADGIVRGAWFDGMWRHWYQLFDRTFPTLGHLAVISRKSGHMEVFGVGTDELLHGVWFDNGWQKWYTLGAPPGIKLTPGTPLAARSRIESHMEVWVVANDGQVWGIWWDGSDWKDWFQLPLQDGRKFPVGAPIAAHCRNADHMEIWAIEESGILRGNWWDSGFQNGWYSLRTPGGTDEGFRLSRGGHLAVLGRNDDHMEVWSIGTDHKMHGIWWDGNWRDWYTLDGRTFPIGAPLIALSRNDDHMEVYSITEAPGPGFVADRLHGIWWDGNWQSWHELDPLPVSRGTPLAGLSRNENHLELWCVAPAGAPPDDIGVHGIWFDGSNWKGFYRVT